MEAGLPGSLSRLPSSPGLFLLACVAPSTCSTHGAVWMLFTCNLRSGSGWKTSGCSEPSQTAFLYRRAAAEEMEGAQDLEAWESLDPDGAW